MVNRNNRIEGRNIGRHPLSDESGQLGIYAKHGSVIAGMAEQPGLITTPEGEMTFQAGDFIVTDNPPTHAWPVRSDVFKSTYRLIKDLSPGQIPTTEPQELEEPDKSVPPADVVDIKIKADEKKGRGIATSESLGMTEKKADG